MRMNQLISIYVHIDGEYFYLILFLYLSELHAHCLKNWLLIEAK